MVILEGKAELLHDPAVNATLPAYAAKYDSLLKSVGLTAEAMATVYSQAILITPTRFLHRQGKRAWEGNYTSLLHFLTASTTNRCSTSFKRSCSVSSVSPSRMGTSSRQITGPASTSGVT